MLAERFGRVALGSTLAVTSLPLVCSGCEASTAGLGAATDEGLGGDPDAGLDASTDTSTGGPDTGGSDPDGSGSDTGPELAACPEPILAPAVQIGFEGKDPLPDACAALSFTAEVAVASAGVYGLVACDCTMPPCEGENAGEKFELSLDLPDPSWLPALAEGGCHEFRVFAEDEGGTCRTSRVDIAHAPGQAPWYSAGAAREPLMVGELNLMPVPADACATTCGAWEQRLVEASVPDAAPELLGWGQTALVGDYELVHWRSWVALDEPQVDQAEAGCDPVGPTELTAWTAR